MSNLHPIFEEILSTTIRQATERTPRRRLCRDCADYDGTCPNDGQPCASPAEPVATRIEFAPGHENERLTDEGVAGKLRLMKLSPRMLAVLRDLVAQLAEHDDRYREPECPLCAAVADARAVIAEAEGRSPQEPA